MFRDLISTSKGQVQSHSALVVLSQQLLSWSLHWIRGLRLFAKDHKPSKIIQGQPCVEKSPSRAILLGCRGSSRVKHLSRVYEGPGLISSTKETTNPTSSFQKPMRANPSCNVLGHQTSCTQSGSRWCLAAAVQRGEHNYFPGLGG